MPHCASRLHKSDAQSGVFRQVFNSPPNGKELRGSDKHLFVQVERRGQPSLPQYSRRPQAETIERPPNRLAHLAFLHGSNVHLTPFLIDARHRDAMGMDVLRS